MDDPKQRILEMLASGKISVEEASALLDKVGDIAQGPQQPEALNTAEHQTTSLPPPTMHEARPEVQPRRPRFLCVKVESAGGDEVNVRLPINLLRTGIKLASLLPKEASNAIEHSGFDLSKLAELEGDELIEALGELEVHIESAGGDQVHIYCE